MRLPLLLLAAVLVGCVPPDPIGDDDDAPPSFPAELAVALGTTLQEQFVTFGPPGIVAAVRLADGSSWVGAVGDADRDDTPLQGGERFRVASVSKSFVAGLVLSLVDDGALSLDDPASEWITEHPEAAEFTVRQLLNHTAGVPEFSLQRDFQQAGPVEWTDEELVGLVADLPLSFTPGSSYGYSNTHYVLLSMIVEDAAGEPWQAELGERLLDPLGLDDTAAPDGSEGWGDVARGYLGAQDLTGSILPSGIGAAGNVVSTADDLARWARGLWGGAALSPASTAALSAGAFEIAPGVSYGLGTLVLEDDHGEQLAHNGALNGYVAWAGYRPALDVGLSVVANAWLPGDPPNVTWSGDVADALWADVLAAVE